MIESRLVVVAKALVCGFLIFGAILAKRWHRRVGVAGAVRRVGRGRRLLGGVVLLNTVNLLTASDPGRRVRYRGRRQRLRELDPGTTMGAWPSRSERPERRDQPVKRGEVLTWVMSAACATGTAVGVEVVVVGSSSGGGASLSGHESVGASPANRSATRP